MRVALLHPTYWPEVRRGSERFVHELAVRLDSARIVTSHPAATTSAIEDGAEVTRHRRVPRARLLRRGFDPWVAQMPVTWWDLRRHGDDVAHALYPTEGVAALRAGRPLVLSAMGFVDRAWLVSARRRLELTTTALRGAGAVVVLSEAARDALWRDTGVAAEVVAPGVDLERFSPDPAARAEHPTILCAADPREPRKRVELLLRALPLVRRERPQTRLVLDAGAGPPRDLSAPGVEHRDLSAPGALEAANREAWVAALPARDEAFGLVLLEAMACGTPVVGAADGAIPEVVPGADVGALFEGDDPAAVARALLAALELAEHPATPVACRAHAARYSWDATAEAYEALYRRAVAA